MIRAIYDTHDYLAAVRDQRRALGWTLEELNARAGLADRYWNKVEAALYPSAAKASKAEKPYHWRRRPFTMQPVAAYATQALGMQLILCPLDLARAICDPHNGAQFSPFYKELTLPSALLVSRIASEKN
jgi:transcriptional regulator with XRE-family HTH domain